MYQCESEHIFYFSQSHFNSFMSYFEVEPKIKQLTEKLAFGTYDKLDKIDDLVLGQTNNWRMERMAITDKIILRIATHELLEKTAPKKVIINEAIELAKRYGSENSGGFVNGILDGIAKKLDI